MGKLFYAEKSCDIHGQSNLRQLELYRSRQSKQLNVLQHTPSGRFLDRHVSNASSELSDTTKKMIAIALMPLVLWCEVHPLLTLAPLISTGTSEPRKKAASPDPTEIKAEPKALEQRLVREQKHFALPETIHRLVDAGTYALGSAVAGPLLANILFRPRSTVVAERFPQSYFDPAAAQERIVNLRASTDKARAYYNEFAKENPKSARAIEMGATVVSTALRTGGISAGVAAFAKLGTSVQEFLDQSPETKKYLQDTAQKSIHVVAPLLRALHPSYTEKESEVAVATGFSAGIEIMKYMHTGLGTIMHGGDETVEDTSESKTADLKEENKDLRDQMRAQQTQMEKMSKLMEEMKLMMLEQRR